LKKIEIGAIGTSQYRVRTIFTIHAYILLWKYSQRRFVCSTAIRHNTAARTFHIFQEYVSRIY